MARRRATDASPSEEAHASHLFLHRRSHRGEPRPPGRRRCPLAARRVDVRAPPGLHGAVRLDDAQRVLADLLGRVARERGAAVELFKRVTADPDAFAAAAATMNQNSAQNHRADI